MSVQSVLTIRVIIWAMDVRYHIAGSKVDVIMGTCEFQSSPVTIFALTVTCGTAVHVACISYNLKP